MRPVYLDVLEPRTYIDHNIFGGSSFYNDCCFWHEKRACWKFTIERVPYYIWSKKVAHFFYQNIYSHYWGGFASLEDALEFPSYLEIKQNE